MRLQTNSQGRRALGEQRTRRLLIVLSLMLQLPVVDRAKSQRQAGRLAESLFVAAKEFGTPQRIDQLPLLFRSVAARVGCDCRLLQPELVGCCDTKNVSQTIAT